MLMLCLGCLLPCASAPAATPLPEPGKQDIYQRVLTRPGARVVANAGDQGAGGELVQAFSRLYVYARAEHAAEPWLRVGADSRGKRILGWLPERQSVPWRQQLIVSFTARGSGRARTLFFRDAAALRAVLADPDPGARGRALLRALNDGDGSGPAVAAEPVNAVDFEQQFYLLPILDHSTYQAPSGDKVRLLQVASVTRTDPSPAPQPNAMAKAPEPALQAPTVVPLPVLDPDQRDGYRAAVVFVIDSTISMRPYIASTKAAVRNFYARIEAAGLLDRVAFGLVAFRAKSSDPERNRRLGYVAQPFVRAAEVRGGDDFLARVADLEEARVSTDYFDEDAYAGILAALEADQWQGRFNERHIILITDAGALDGGRGSAERVASTTGLDAERLQAIARTSETSLAVLHLQTPEAGRNGNTEPAADQYRVLSFNKQNQRSAYFPIRGGDLGQFDAAIDAYAQRLIDNIQGFSAGRLAFTAMNTVPAQSALAPPSSLTEPASPADDAADPDVAQIADIRAVVDSLGYAMQLAYLGRVERAQAPEVFRAWISDRDLADPAQKSVAVQVLLTKNQLSNLQDILRRIIDTAEASLTDRDDASTFFERLKSLAAKYSVDPDSGGRRKAIQLVDLGLLGEYLADLPYQSDVLSLSQDTWVRWGIQRQVEFIDELHKKIRLYRYFNEDLLGWVDLSQSGISDPSEFVYPVPLEQLP
jgi:serine/threonine-protein kinase PpkA